MWGEKQGVTHGTGPGTATPGSPLPAPPRPSLTSSPLGMRRLEMMMILSSLSKVTTSATQFGAHEWLMYLGGVGERGYGGAGVSPDAGWTGQMDSHCSLWGGPTTLKAPHAHLAGPPVSVASMTCSLLMRNM